MSAAGSCSACAASRWPRTAAQAPPESPTRCGSPSAQWESGWAGPPRPRRRTQGRYPRPSPPLASLRQMNRDEIFERIRAHLADELEVDPARIGEDTRFKEDLQADSLHLVELTVELEDTYGVKIPDDDAARLLTVGQATDYVASHAPETAS